MTMASPLRNDDKRAALFAEVARLRIAVVAAEQKAGELLDGEDAATEASVMVAATRMLLDAAKDRYIEASENEHASKCPVHGDALYVCCPQCQVAWGYQPARVA
jgi:hypothetical protein